MSQQLPGITEDYFLSGQPFYYQNTPAFIYRFSADDNNAKRGILISDQRSKPQHVNAIHDKGFTMLVINKPMNVRFSDCHTPVNRMKKNDLLNEKTFIYRGTFTHLTDKQLQFDRAKNLIIEAKENQLLTIQTIQDEKFAVIVRGFGVIPIYYHECELIAETSK
ncbi:hypothetical protein ACRQ5D_10730 [Mucilaginibacter sp. P25]|uniref:hypothetical protein n=1 Tax=Mucilaginibacter sp. P25 TaxID=3423945 RepID=UPI003D7B242B